MIMHQWTQVASILPMLKIVTKWTITLTSSNSKKDGKDGRSLCPKEISPSKRDAIGKAAGSSHLNFSQAVVRNQAMMVVPTQPIQKPKNINFVGKRQTVEGGLSRGLTAVTFASEENLLPC